METLHDRLSDLADDAPTGGAPAAELWARGRRAHRRRVASLAAAAVVVGAVGTGIGVRLAGGDGDGDRVDPAPAPPTVRIDLPIDYPHGRELPDLGQAPGPLAAVWLAPREPYTVADDDPGRPPQVVGLVVETGQFGTLSMDLYPWSYAAPDSNIALSLSPDGRRIAYVSPTGVRGGLDDPAAWKVMVRDLVTGAEYSPAFDYGVRAGATWVDDTHLLGYVYPGGDADGWLWDASEPASAPTLVDPYDYTDGTWIDPPYFVYGGDPSWTCTSPTITDSEGRSDASVLCDRLGLIDARILLGHRSPGARQDPDILDRAVIAVDISDEADFPFDDPALRRVVVTPGAPYPVSFAEDVIGAALEADGAS